MKRAIAGFIIMCSSLAMHAQRGCPVVRDTVVSGLQAGSFSRHLFDAAGKVYQINFYQPGTDPEAPSDFTHYAALSYDGSGRLSGMRVFMNTAEPLATREIEYSYRDGKISRMGIAEHGNSSWSMNYEVSYDQAGNMSAIVIDRPSMRCSDCVFNGSFLDIAWSNGNPVSFNVDLEGAVIGIAATYDNHPNIYRKLADHEGPVALLLASSKNNMLQWKVTTDGTAKGIPVRAGNSGLQRAYTYDSNNEVTHIINIPSLLATSPDEARYFTNCKAEKAPFTLLPETAFSMDSIGSNVTLQGGFMFKEDIQIFSVTGLATHFLRIYKMKPSLDISGLQPGVYYAELTDGKKDYRARIVKY